MFGILQRIGRSFMLPIALLPALGLMLGIGGSFTDDVFINNYHLGSIMGHGTIIYNILFVLKQVGVSAFQQLPSLFAIGVAVGMAKTDKGTAAIAGFMAYIVMHITISTLLNLTNVTALTTTPEYIMAHQHLSHEKAVAISNNYDTYFGYFSLRMSVMGGIIAGLIASYLHNKFYKIELPKILGFFSGSRFVPIITSFVMLIVGLILFYVWPFFQIGLNSLGGLVNGTGIFGTFIFSFIWRALNPIGLHHAFYLPFWETEVGGHAVIAGKTVIGAHNIIMQSLVTPSAHGKFNDYARFTSGNYMWMIFGMPGIALAMIKTALPEKRKMVASIVVSAAATSVITGITEPIEFLFLFAAPGLFYGFHTVVNGLTAVLTQILHIGVGTSFSCGLIDLSLFGILPGTFTNWYYIILIGPIFFFVYYFVFKWAITKFNIATPGRRDDENLAVDEVSDKKSKNFVLTQKIVEELGGYHNLESVEACATKLRITVKDKELVTKQTDIFKQKLEALGYYQSDRNIQIPYGTRASLLATEINESLDEINAD